MRYTCQVPNRLCAGKDERREPLTERMRHRRACWKVVEQHMGASVWRWSAVSRSWLLSTAR
jgi:hypothetical protein